MMKKIFIIVFCCAAIIKAQDVDVSAQLKQIKNGEIEKANLSLKELRVKYPDDPAVIFLDALLTKDGDVALNRYETIVRKYPNSQFADASLYCMFSYHYALGNYKKAESCLSELKTNYPDSKYIKNADRNLDLEPDLKTVKPIKTEKKEITEIKDNPKKVVEQINNNYKYCIQAGAFLNLDKVKELEEKLIKAGYQAEIKEKNVGGTNFNLLLVGKFKTREEAIIVLDELDKNYSIKGRVIDITD
ncbi:MAG: SPOR domain-containing protein [bacterium]